MKIQFLLATVILIGLASDQHQPDRALSASSQPLLSDISFDVQVSQERSQPETAEENRSTLIQQGEYIANHVAMCVQCHTPRNDAGELDRQRLFHGGPIPLQSPFPNQVWAFFAPRIAGLPSRSEQDVAELLEIGRDSRGWSPREPMPPFRMTRQDAAAVAAYLESLR